MIVKSTKANMPTAILNGKLINENEATISIADKGYFFDFAVYSSIKVIKGKIFFPDYHIDRLFESAELIGIKHNFKKEEVLEWLKKLITTENIQDALLRLVFIGDPDNNNQEKLFIFPVSGLTFYPDKLYKHGAKVITFNGERRIPQAKTKDLLMSFIAYNQAKEQNALDAILIDNQGNIREGTRTNFFVIKGQTIFTPPANKTLEGITKKIILEIAQNHFEIKEIDIPLKNIGDYEEIFISSTSMNIMPIRQIDNLIFETVFPKTHLLAQLFKEYCAKQD